MVKYFWKRKKKPNTLKHPNSTPNRLGEKKVSSKMWKKDRNNCWGSCALSQGWAGFLSQRKGVGVGHDWSLATLLPWHTAETSPQPLALVKTALDNVQNATCREKEKQSSVRFFQICLQFYLLLHFQWSISTGLKAWQEKENFLIQTLWELLPVLP